MLLPEPVVVCLQFQDVLFPSLPLPAVLQQFQVTVILFYLSSFSLITKDIITWLLLVASSILLHGAHQFAIVVVQALSLSSVFECAYLLFWSSFN